MPEAKLRAAEQDLSDLCEAHWRELRGSDPTSPLAHALWSVTPPLADMFADLYAAGSSQLAHLLQGHKPAWGLALLVLGQIECSDAEGARLAYEAMMVFESETAAAHYARHVAAMLRLEWQAAPLHRHTSLPPLWKALAAVAAHTRRFDLKAVICVIQLLAGLHTASQPMDESLGRLRDALGELGVHFLGIDDKQVRYEQHGRMHKPASLRQVGDMLIQIRQAWLAGPHSV